MGSHWLHWKAKSSLWALAVSNGGFNHQIYPKSENLTLFQVFLISSYYLTVLNGLSLTTLKSEEFTLSSGSFEWGGLIVRFTLNLKIWPCFKFSLYLPIIWLFWMGAHWCHWKAYSWLSALAVLNGGGFNHQIYPKSENLTSFQVFLISSYYGSLAPLKSVELTQRPGSFVQGG